jgi:hypothetical protein
VIDWDGIASQITQKHMEMDARQAHYDIHAKINKEVADEVKRFTFAHQTERNNIYLNSWLLLSLKL